MATTHTDSKSHATVTPQDALPIAGTDATLRDLFAAQAVSGLCTPSPSVSLGTPESIAVMAYRVADALISARDPVMQPLAAAEPVGAHVK
jgi:hypothetical protein